MNRRLVRGVAVGVSILVPWAWMHSLRRKYPLTLVRSLQVPHIAPLECAWQVFPSSPFRSPASQSGKHSSEPYC